MSNLDYMKLMLSCTLLMTAMTVVSTVCLVASYLTH